MLVCPCLWGLTDGLEMPFFYYNNVLYRNNTSLWLNKMTGATAQVGSVACWFIYSFTQLANNILLINTPISSWEKATYFLFYSAECAPLRQNVMFPQENSISYFFVSYGARAEKMGLWGFPHHVPKTWEEFTTITPMQSTILNLYQNTKS